MPLKSLWKDRSKTFGHICLSATLIVSATLSWRTHAETSFPSIPQKGDVLFSPNLTVSRNDNLCRSILQSAQDEFFSRDALVDIRENRSLSVIWPLTDESGPVKKYVYEKYPKRLVALSAPESGERGAPSIAVWETPHGFRGSAYSLSVFPSRMQMQAAVDTAIADGSYSLQHQDGVGVMDSVWSKPAIFFHQGQFYLVDGYGRGPGFIAQELQITELTAKGRGKAICSVRVQPENFPQEILPSLSKLMNILDKVVGEGGNCEGSSHPNDRLRAQFPSMVSIAMSRPWATLSATDSREKVDFYLKEWSRQGLAFKAHYDELQRTLPQVATDLAAYYRLAFGYDEQTAATIAKHLADWILRAHFSFPGGETVPQSLPDYGYFLWLQDGNIGPSPNIKKLRRDLRSLILRDVPIETIKNSVSGIIADRSKEDVRLILPIADSLGRLDVLNLLMHAGGNVNSGNIFGKTPLMVAAHLDLEAAAANLIEAGADPNRKTRATNECPVKIDIGNRTALFYAAENASISLIQLLLENRADANAVDTRGRTALDYLNLSGMPDADKLKAAELIRSYMN